MINSDSGVNKSWFYPYLGQDDKDRIKYHNILDKVILMLRQYCTNDYIFFHKIFKECTVRFLINNHQYCEYNSSVSFVLFVFFVFVFLPFFITFFFNYSGHVPLRGSSFLGTP